MLSVKRAGKGAMQDQPAKRRDSRFQICEVFLIPIIGSFLWDIFHPEMHFLDTSLACAVVVPAAAGLGLSKTSFPGSVIAKILIVGTAGALGLSAWYVVANYLLRG